MQGLDLDRAPDRGKIAGVCAGVAERWRIDPLLVRVAAVILGLCSGVGAVLYGAAWALLPAQGESDGLLMRKFPAARKVPVAGWFVIVGGLSIVALATLGSMMPISTGPVIAVAVLWYIGIYRPGKRREQERANEESGNVGTNPAGLASGPNEPLPGTPPYRATGTYPTGTYPTDPPMPGYRTTDHPMPGSFRPPAHLGGPSRPEPGWEPDGFADQLPPVIPHASSGRTDWHSPPARTPDPESPRPTNDGRDGAGDGRDGTGERCNGAGHGRDRTGGARLRTDRGPGPRRILTLAIVAIGVAICSLALVDGLGLASVPMVGYAAVALLIVGAALVASAWTSRVRGLLPLGCLLVVLTLVGLIAANSPQEAWSSDRSYAAMADVPDHETFDVGEVRVDLSGLDVDRNGSYAVSVDSGTLTVVLPRDANVVINATTDVGSISMLGEELSGVELTTVRTLEEHPGKPVLHLDLRVDFGSITVVRS